MTSSAQGEPPSCERYGQWVRLTPARIEATRRFVDRYGAFAIFAARFLPGLRFLAGPPWRHARAFARWSS